MSNKDRYFFFQNFGEYYTKIGDNTNAINNFEKAISSLKRRRKDIDVITNDLKDICSVITKNIESSYDSNGVFDLAAAYEARFKETMADDYSVENNNKKEI
jgi:hypothetical protein